MNHHRVMKHLAGLLCVFLLAMALFPVAVQAQEEELDAADRARIVTSIQQHLRDKYVFEDLGIAMGDLVQSRLANGDYDAITHPEEFARVLTEDLRSVSHDLHLRVGTMSAAQDPVRRGGWTPPIGYDNYMFVAVERLRGNIGYIRFDGFVELTLDTRHIIEAAMFFLRNVDAFIFDLRYNGGGSPETVQLISSYLFSNTPVHLNSLYDRSRDTTTEYWTLENIEGRRKPYSPVFILTSGRTFSAAEEFTYNLQSLDRATVVGEVTGGGAHPTMTIQLSNNMLIGVPFARAVNPVTGTNWEGTGIIPDVEVDAADALTTAHLLAFDVLIDQAGGTSKGDYLRWERDNQAVEYAPAAVDRSVLESYAGTYQGEAVGTFALELTEDRLARTVPGFPAMPLIPMSETLFFFTENMRLEFHLDAEGAVSHVTFVDPFGEYDSAFPVP